MDLGGMLGNLLQQYAGGGAASDEEAHGHFDQLTAGADASSLASAMGAMMRSPETPAFGSMAAQLFGEANRGQKAGMLLASGAPAVLSQLSAMIPGLGSGQTVTPEQAAAVPPGVVDQLAQHAEAHDPSVLDRMSGFYAEHPTLVKTLGTGAMIIAMRELGKAIGPKA